MLKKFIILLSLTISSFAYAENIELSADNGLEWDQKQTKITMKKNATAKTAEYKLTADLIEAFYKEPNKNIYKVIAIDNVKVDSQNEHITTDKVIYDIDNEIITLIADKNSTHLKNKDSEIIAKGEVIYYRTPNYATAKDAKIINTGRELFADNLKVYFQKTGKKDTNELKSITANGNIKLVDGAEELYGDNAEYNPQNGYATITDNVYFKKADQANLSGGKIIYDMKTGIAKILPKDNESKVKGVFSTNK